MGGDIVRLDVEYNAQILIYNTQMEELISGNLSRCEWFGGLLFHHMLRYVGPYVVTLLNQMPILECTWEDL